jgi:hypothetical protein
MSLDTPFIRGVTCFLVLSYGLGSRVLCSGCRNVSPGATCVIFLWHLQLFFGTLHQMKRTAKFKAGSLGFTLNAQKSILHQ